MVHGGASSGGTVALRDGRALSFGEWGRPGDPAVLYLHGAIGTPPGESVELRAALARVPVHYVMVDRPGFGRSDACPGRTVLGFAADVEQLADALGLERFAVLGVSAGGPYAAACAHALPERVTAAALVSALGPLTRPHALRGMPVHQRFGLRLLARFPRGATAAGDPLARLLQRHPGLLARAIDVHAGTGGGDAPADPDARARALEGFLGSAAAGVGGMVRDYVLSTGPWGFDPAGVQTEVQVWHGARDTIVPVEHAWQLAIVLPRCRAAIDPGEGHFFFRRRMVEILGALVGREADGARLGRPPLRLGPTDAR